MLSLLFVLHAELAGAACSRVLRVPFEEWPPYSFTGSQQKPQGIEVDMLDAITRQAGCTVQWVPDLPRKRRWLYLQSGDIDMLLAASDSGPAGERAAMFSKPYRHETISAFVMADSDRHTGLASLQHMLAHRVSVIGQTGGGGGFPMAEQFRAAGLLTRYEEYSHGLKLLQARRGEVLIGDRWAVEYAARAQDVRLRRLAFNVADGEVAYMLSRKTLSSADLAAINSAIERLDANGTLARIRRRWMANL
ncbi:substrate-binding periplasmic protein [Chitinimonas sp.]|uniref:substrate-binding periplasmic protein n=1 Tax=Chitinimonas sp. TaxID=1934313 RepID=UPI0035AD7D32